MLLEFLPALRFLGPVVWNLRCDQRKNSFFQVVQHLQSIINLGAQQQPDHERVDQACLDFRISGLNHAGEDGIRDRGCKIFYRGGQSGPAS